MMRLQPESSTTGSNSRLKRPIFCCRVRCGAYRATPESPEEKTMRFNLSEMGFSHGADLPKANLHQEPHQNRFASQRRLGVRRLLVHDWYPFGLPGKRCRVGTAVARC